MIPGFQPDGLLPPGLHPATWDEFSQRYGWTEHRHRLLAGIKRALAALKAAGCKRVYIDGSFVTAKSAPNDIDIVSELRTGHDFERDLPMSEYALVSRSLLRRRFGLDVVVAERESVVYKTYVEFFTRVREVPELRKGLLRVTL